jgi:simple sugar transport system permease protein
MSLAWFDGIVKEIAAGRGFIALACVVFAGLSPLLALAAAFIFGFAEALAYTVMVMPGAKIYPFLPYFLQMVPYIVPLVIVTIFIGRRPFPKALAKPYIRE